MKTYVNCKEIRIWGDQVNESKDQPRKVVLTILGSEEESKEFKVGHEYELMLTK